VQAEWKQWCIEILREKEQKSEKYSLLGILFFKFCEIMEMKFSHFSFSDMTFSELSSNKSSVSWMTLHKFLRNDFEKNKNLKCIFS